MMGKMGVNVVSAWNGNEAITASRTQKFDLILMDLQVCVCLCVCCCVRLSVSLSNTTAPRVQTNRFTRLKSMEMNSKTY